MWKPLSTALVALGLVHGAAVADALPGAIDLASFDQVREPAVESALDDVSIHEVASWNRSSSRQVYVTGILGSSFSTLNDDLYQGTYGGSVNGSVLAAGGAIGAAYARDNGQLRLEFEAMGRDDLVRHATVPPFAGSVAWGARDGWSTLVNLWRDYSVTDRLGIYAGGGIGGGGYRFGFGGQLTDGGETIDYFGGSNVATFAWQGGGGVIYRISDRIDFDIGYRFFALEPATTTLGASWEGQTTGTYDDIHRFTSSELLFSLRIYEPFRRWR